MIPGARGGTPQVYGVSAQMTAAQAEAAQCLHLLLSLRSDAQRHFAGALLLPILTYADPAPLCRVTLIADGGMIRHVMHREFPPDRNAQNTRSWSITCPDLH